METPVILITGSTGFIGGATLARLLLSQQNCRILLLVRANSPDAALSRVANSISRFTDLARVQAALGRCEFICGDLTDRPLLDDPRLDEVTHALHLAANTS